MELFRIAFWAFEHVGDDSVSGPSSRMLPQRTKSVPRRTHSYMMPEVRMPCSTALRMPPARRIRLMARRWWAWPSGRVALVEIHAEARAEQRLLDVVGWPGRCRRRARSRSPCESSAWRHSPLPVWTMAGPPTSEGLLPARRLSASSWAIRRMANSFGFSVETVLARRRSSP